MSKYETCIFSIWLNTPNGQIRKVASIRYSLSSGGIYSAIIPIMVSEANTQYEKSAQENAILKKKLPASVLPNLSIIADSQNAALIDGTSITFLGSEISRVLCIFRFREWNGFVASGFLQQKQ